MRYALGRHYEYEMTFTISDAYINYELLNELCSPKPQGISIDSRIKALKKELKYTRSVLEKKQIQQELNILYKERKNGHK